MKQESKKAILIPWVGKSSCDGLSALRCQVQREYPGIPVELLQIEDEKQVERVCSSLQERGVSRVLVQPAYLLTGLAWRRLREKFPAVAAGYGMCCGIGAPLLYGEGDYKLLGSICVSMAEDMAVDAVVCVGHGTKENVPYTQLAAVMEEIRSGLSGVFVITLQEDWTRSGLIQKLQEKKCKKVCLIPLMMTAGKHTREDICGGMPHSVESRLEQAGFFVVSQAKGLLNIPEVQRLLVNRMKELEKDWETENINGNYMY
jgi:sirohydrochlorin cobaltochelatase